MDEILRVIDVNEDFGTDDIELKNAIIGKTSPSIQEEYIDLTIYTTDLMKSVFQTVLSS